MQRGERVKEKSVGAVCKKDHTDVVEVVATTLVCTGLAVICIFLLWQGCDWCYDLSHNAEKAGQVGDSLDYKSKEAKLHFEYIEEGIIDIQNKLAAKKK